MKTKILYGNYYTPAVYRINGDCRVGLYRMVYFEGKSKPLIEFYCKEFGYSYHRAEKFYRLALIYNKVKGLLDHEYIDCWIKYLELGGREDIKHIYKDSDYAIRQAIDRGINGYIMISDGQKERLILLQKQIGQMALGI